jgi:hypothetical protein
MLAAALHPRSEEELPSAVTTADPQPGHGQTAPTPRPEEMPVKSIRRTTSVGTTMIMR